MGNCGTNARSRRAGYEGAPEQSYDEMPIVESYHFGGPNYNDTREGPISRHGVVWLSNCVRAETLSLVNDPRMGADNVISKRLQAFDAVMVAASFIATTAVSSIVQPGVWLAQTWTGHSHLQQSRFEMSCAWFFESVGMTFMLLTMMLNLTCVLIITHQHFHCFRLMTCAAHGFDVAKSYYLHSAVIFFRHAAIKMFFLSIPVYIVGIACMVYIKVRSCHIFRIYKWIFMFMAVLAAMVIHVINAKHSEIFKKKYELLWQHEQVIKGHISHMDSVLDPLNIMP